MAKGLFGRLLRKATTKAPKVVKKPTKKATTAAKQTAVRARATKAAKTKVNIPKAGRKVGQQATLNGKPVYWGGKDWGWQSKASLTKIENGSKTKPPAKPNTTRLPVSTTDRSPEVARTRSKAVRRSRKDQGYDSREERLATNRAQNRQPKQVTDRKGVKASEPQVTGPQYTRGTKPKSRTKTTETKGSQNPAAGQRGTKTTHLTKAQRDRRSLTNKRDIGAKAAAAKTPKSTKKTASQAGGPVTKGRDVKNSADITAKQRDGKSKSYGTAKQPRGTNPRQAPSGKVRTTGEEKANKALKNFNVEQRILDMKEKYNAKNAPNLTGAERQAKIRAETKALRAKAKGLRGQVQDKVKRQADAARFNQSPGKADRSDQALGRDWRNRLSDSSAERHSEHMTRVRSGKPVRGNGELVQGPKGKSSVNGDTRPNLGAGPGKKASTGEGLKIGKPTSKTVRSRDPKTGEVSVSRPTPNGTKPKGKKAATSTTTKPAEKKKSKKPKGSTDPRTNGSRTQAQQTMKAVRARRAKAKKALE